VYGSEFTAEALREWLDKVGVNTAYIEPGSPWENGYIESFNADYARNYSMEKSLTRSSKPRYSSNAGACITTKYAHTAHSMEDHQPLKPYSTQRTSQNNT